MVGHKAKFEQTGLGHRWSLPEIILFRWCTQRHGILAMVTPQRWAAEEATFFMKVLGTRQGKLQRRPYVIIWGFFIIMGCPLGIFHQCTVVRKREENVLHTSQQIGGRFGMEALKALVRNEAKDHSLRTGQTEKTPLLLMQVGSDTCRGMRF